MKTMQVSIERDLDKQNNQRPLPPLLMSSVGGVSIDSGSQRPGKATKINR